MKNTVKSILSFAAASSFLCAVTALDMNSALESSSRVDWTQNKFSSAISLDVAKAKIMMPSGRNAADALIKMKIPTLIKDPLLSLYVDNENYLGDIVEKDSITLEQIAQIIEDAKMTSTALSLDGKKLGANNIITMTNIGKLLVKHQYPYTAPEPLEIVSSRPYTGIIIDARGSIPVHGEYVASEVYPCFFPQIWDDEMNLIYERNMIERSTAETKGIVHYDYSDDNTRYESTTGTDPLYIKTSKVYGRNRTDPLIKKRDALKILTVPENLELLRKGKVVILLDKHNLISDVAAPEKNASYYASYRTVKRYIYENKVPGIDISDNIEGIQFSVDLKFRPDSAELLAEESRRIAQIAEMLQEIIRRNEFTILVEGHTADLGKPAGQMNLSIARTITVMNALIQEGLPKELFSYKGYGATRPRADNNTEEGRRQNRRVVITARPRATYVQHF